MIERIKDLRDQLHMLRHAMLYNGGREKQEYRKAIKRIEKACNHLTKGIELLQSMKAKEE